MVVRAPRKRGGERRERALSGMAAVREPRGLPDAAPADAMGWPTVANVGVNPGLQAAAEAEAEAEVRAPAQLRR